VLLFAVGMTDSGYRPTRSRDVPCTESDSLFRCGSRSTGTGIRRWLLSVRYSYEYYSYCSRQDHVKSEAFS
jgi:hypothetical protein